MTDDVAPVPRRVMLVTIAVVMLSAAVAQGFGRFTYGVVLPAVRDDLLDGSNTLAGLLGTANTFAYLAGALIVGSLASRLGPVGWIRLGLVSSVTGILLAVVAPNGAVLAGALILMGLGGAAIWIPSPGIATTVVAPKWRGLAVGVMGAGVGTGIVFTGQLNSFVTDQGRTWRTVYGVESLLGLLALALAIFVLRSRSDAPSRSGGFGGFDVLRTIEGWRPITAAYAAYGFGYLLVVAFLVARLEDDAGWSGGRASAMFTLLGASTLVGGISAGRVSDIFGRRRTLIVAFAAFAGFAMLLLTDNTATVAVGAIGCGVLFSGMPTVIAAYIIDRTDTTTYGPSYAAATFAFGVAQVMSPQAGGAIADWRGSFTLVFIASAVVMLGGSAICLALPRDDRSTPDASLP